MHRLAATGLYSLLTKCIQCSLSEFSENLFLGAVAKLRSMSIRASDWNNSASTGRIFIKFDIWAPFEKYVEKIRVSLKSGKNNGTLNEDQYTVMIISPSFFLEWKMCQTKVVEKIKTHILCSLPFFTNILPFMR